MPKHTYTPLPTPTSIRLLTLEPERERNASAYLEDVDLDNNPHFEALSYTWQDPDAESLESGEENIHIRVEESGSLRITKNLHAILQHLIASLEPSTKRRIWIDQISINQEDLEERSQQVSIMHRIYSQAEQTLIWLGRPNQHSPAFLRLLRDFIDPPFDWESKITNNLYYTLSDRVERILHSAGRYAHVLGS